MAEETGQEKTEQPTPKRLKDSRDKGQVARSKELSTTIVLLASCGGMILLGGDFIQGLLDMFKSSLTIDRESIFDSSKLLTQLLDMMGVALLTAMPFFIVVTVAALSAPIFMGGMLFSTKAMAFKLDKLNPIKGIKKIFAVRGLVELAKALAKFVLILSVAASMLWFQRETILSLGREPLEQALTHLGTILGWSLLVVSSSMILVTAVDVPFQLWDHTKQLKMTRQEVKDEMKETDGNPEMKGRLRSMQQEVAQRRMMAEIPTADVVITNPTHYAIAIRYDQDGIGAPIVVAKGADFIAAEIRRLATEYEVPMLPAPPLARALYYSTDINDEIPSGLYLAVAQVLAYVFQLKGKTKVEKRDFEDLPIPDELRKDE